MFGKDLQYRAGLSQRGKWVYRLLGELYIGDRIRSIHVFQKLRELGLPNDGTSVLDAGCGGGGIFFHFSSSLFKRSGYWRRD